MFCDRDRLCVQMVDASCVCLVVTGGVEFSENASEYERRGWMIGCRTSRFDFESHPYMFRLVWVLRILYLTLLPPQLHASTVNDNNNDDDD